MADEQYQWLDGDAAERLLRGEPLEAVDDHARVQAERLAAMLGQAASAPALPGVSASGELPGEAAALAAFRAARGAHATRVDAAPGAAPSGLRSGSGDTAVLGDSGAVRIGSGAEQPRTRWGRPLRYGLAAALAACTLGGVAMAGAGVIPTPFGGEEPGPGTSVSASPTGPDPLISPTPGTSGSGHSHGGSGSATPDGEVDGTAPGAGHPSQGGGDASASDGIVPTPTDTALPREKREEWYARVVDGCRDYLAGKPMDAEKKRRIESSAGGPEGVRSFCTKVVSGEGSGGREGGSGRDGEDGEDGEGSSGGSEGGKDSDRNGGPAGNKPVGNGGTGAVVTPTSAGPTSSASASASPTVTATATGAAPSTTASPAVSPTSTSGSGAVGNP
ncbi:hypothetical protein [Streptomyces sp. Da 82-17]|uniref:hypothetical protein n=1 Tax=Streptomyces sp. Da 82-17 TaxID=3377116 RepID=UPI0038D394D6